MFSNHHQGQCAHTISQRIPKYSHPCKHFQSDYLHTLFLRKRRPASRRRTILGATQGACDATQPDSEKRIVKSMSAPRRNVVLPQSDAHHNRQALPTSQDYKSCYSATRPGTNTQPPQSDTPEKVSPVSSTCTKGAKGEARTHGGEDGTRTRNLPQAKRAHHQIVLHPQKTQGHQSTMLDHGQSAPGRGFEPQ